MHVWIGYAIFGLFGYCLTFPFGVIRGGGKEHAAPFAFIFEGDVVILENVQQCVFKK